MGASLWLDEVLYYNFERVPAVRSVEMGRPGSFWPSLLGPFAYCDLQRAVHTIFDLFGLHLSTNPELYLRLPSLVFFGMSAIAIYGVAARAGSDWLWASGVALAFGSMPIFLFYAFEARVYSFSALLVIVFLGLLAAVLEGARGWTVGLAAVLGIIIAWTQVWSACLLAAIAICLPLIVWRDTEHWRKGARVALLIGFGLALIGVQALYVFSLRIPGQTGIPLFEPQPFQRVFWSTVYGPFLGLLRGYPEYFLGILLVISMFRLRARPVWCLPLIVAVALALSVVAMAKVGFGVSPRHQTALYAGIFVCLALANQGLVSRALLVILIGLNLVLLPRTAAKIEEKGNAKQISQVIRSADRTGQIPIVVQHSYTIGYPDPLHSFALALYLDRVEPGEARTPILELPTHRDVRNVLIDRDYFVNGARRLDFFTSSPVEEWVNFLKNMPQKALWLVAPTGSPSNVLQQRRYESALKQAGFSMISGFPREFYGYPMTKLMLFRKSETSK